MTGQPTGVQCRSGRTPAVTASATSRCSLMTVGELSGRTGVSVRLLRECADTGLVYTVGRGAANYRLFDDSALWCVRWIGNLQLRAHRGGDPRTRLRVSRAGRPTHRSPGWRSGCPWYARAWTR